MTVKEIRKICKPLGLKVSNKWGAGFLVQGPKSSAIKKLKGHGVEVSGIGLGYDYNAKVVTLYVSPA